MASWPASGYRIGFSVASHTTSARRTAEMTTTAGWSPPHLACTSSGRRLKARPPPPTSAGRQRRPLPRPTPPSSQHRLDRPSGLLVQPVHCHNDVSNTIVCSSSQVNVCLRLTRPPRSERQCAGAGSRSPARSAATRPSAVVRRLPHRRSLARPATGSWPGTGRRPSGLSNEARPALLISSGISHGPHGSGERRRRLLLRAARANDRRGQALTGAENRQGR